MSACALSARTGPGSWMVVSRGRTPHSWAAAGSRGCARITTLPLFHALTHTSSSWGGMVGNGDHGSGGGAEGYKRASETSRVVQVGQPAGWVNERHVGAKDG